MGDAQQGDDDVEFEGVVEQGGNGGSQGAEIEEKGPKRDDVKERGAFAHRLFPFVVKRAGARIPRDSAGTRPKRAGCAIGGASALAREATPVPRAR